MRRLALVLALALALAACGGSSKPKTSDEQAQIKSAYEKFFSGKTSVTDRVALLQNGSRFKGLVTSFASNPLAKNALELKRRQTACPSCGKHEGCTCAR